jgi:hypothetical protein
MRDVAAQNNVSVELRLLGFLSNIPNYGLTVGRIGGIITNG